MASSKNSAHCQPSDEHAYAALDLQQSPKLNKRQGMRAPARPTSEGHDGAQHSQRSPTPVQPAVQYHRTHVNSQDRVDPLEYYFTSRRRPQSPKPLPPRPPFRLTKNSVYHAPPFEYIKRQPRSRTSWTVDLCHHGEIQHYDFIEEDTKLLKVVTLIQRRFLLSDIQDDADFDDDLNEGFEGDFVGSFHKSFHKNIGQRFNRNFNASENRDCTDEDIKADTEVMGDWKRLLETGVGRRIKNNPASDMHVQGARMVS